jgi:hypothetical protein
MVAVEGTLEPRPPLVLVGTHLVGTWRAVVVVSSTCSQVRIVYLVSRLHLISLSDNGGDGGDASSGDAFAYSKGGKAKAYSGHGGDASGGSVKPGYDHGYRSGGLIDVASGVYILNRSLKQVTAQQ